MEEKELAQIMYEGYCAHTGNKSLATGQSLPVWENLAPVIQEAWKASATAAENHLKGN